MLCDFTRFRVITFDCYGTLIDWETGILSALRPILSAHRKYLDDAGLLELYGELEAEAEAEGQAFQPYRN
ncbi:MAG: 2-haloacid dehalogenase, partial [Acidobacteriaceae bacterium]